MAAIVKQYQMEVEAGIKLIKEFYAMKPYIMAEFEKDKETGETKQIGGNAQMNNKIIERINQYLYETGERQFSDNIYKVIDKFLTARGY